MRKNLRISKKKKVLKRLEIKMGNRKIIVIGIDGTSWNMLYKGISKGILPTFGFLIENSINGISKSVIPPISPSAWNAMYAGTLPGKTGIFNFFDFDEKSYSYSPIFRKNRKVPTIFSILSLYSKKVFAVNLPFYYPPESVNGVVIPGLGSPKVQIFPKEFKREIKSIIPNFTGDIEDLDTILNRDKVQLKRKAERIFRETQELIRYFFKKDYDLGFFVFRAHEPLKHFYFEDNNLILHFYSLIDGILQNIINQISTKDVLLLVSDHGFRKIRCYIRINNFLESIGLFKCKQKRQIPILDVIGNILFRISPRLVRILLSNSFIWKLLGKLPNKSISYLNAVVWEDTKAFYLEGSEGIIRINLEGRESKGCVSKEEYKIVRSMIVSKLKSLRSQDGKKAVRDVIPIEKIYGEESRKYGDLIVIPEGGYVFCGGYSPNSVIFDYKRGEERPGEHDIDGIFIIYSKDQKLIKKGGRNVASVVDIAPTILSIFGLPVPDYMDGKPILGLEYSKTYSEKIGLFLKIKKLKESGKL